MKYISSILCAALAVALASAPALAQTTPANDRQITSQSLSATGSCTTGTNAALVRLEGASATNIVVTGTFVGTLTFNTAGDDKLTFNTELAYPAGGGVGVSTATSTGTWFLRGAGKRWLCVYLSAYTSGTAKVHLEASTAQTPAEVPTLTGVRAVADGAAPTAVAAGQVGPSIGSLERIPYVLPFHPNKFNCNVAVSTATTLQAVGGSCVAPGAGLSLYVTDVEFSSSAASTTAADSFPTLKYGTGGTCGSGTAVFWSGLSPANTSIVSNMTTPIKIPANNEICWIHSVAGSKVVRVSGFIAP